MSRTTALDDLRRNADPIGMHGTVLDEDLNTRDYYEFLDNFPRWQEDKRKY